MADNVQSLTAPQEKRAPGIHDPGGRLFVVVLAAIGSVYLFFVFGMLLALSEYTKTSDYLDALRHPDIRYSIWLSLISCTITTLLSLWAAVPIGYLMARYSPDRSTNRGRALHLGKQFLDALLDIPIVLPPMVIGIALLILFQTEVGQLLERTFRVVSGWFGQSTGITYEIPAVILAQFMVACAFAVRTMRATFEQLSPRTEQVALTLGCTRAQAFFEVVLPEARRGMLTAATLAWARALGEFGPILIFAGATRGRTEVLPTTVFLEFSVGSLNSAAAVSMLMVMAAIAVLVIVRLCGLQEHETRLYH